MLEERPPGSGHDDAPGVQHVGAMGDAEERSHVLAGGQDCQTPASGKIPERRREPGAEGRREPEERVVEHKAAGSRHERPPERDHLLLARRELLDGCVRSRREHGEELLDERPCRGRPPARVGQVGAHGQIRADREIVEQAPALGERGHAERGDPVRRKTVEPIGAEADAPAPDRELADDRAQSTRRARIRSRTRPTVVVT
jgi:hypothetical protein